jgi:hypothetical protein
MADAAPSNNDGNCLPPPPPIHYRDDSNSSTHEDEGYYNAANGDTSKASFQPLAVSSASEDEMDVEGDLSLNELMYSAHSFHVISLPVTITMVLAAMAVTYINTPETIAQGEQLMSQAYHVWKVDAETDSTSKQLALDFANSLVIVSAIGAMTFGIVLLYKYRCMKVLIGYMMFSSMTLLGVLGAELFDVAINKYRIPIGEKLFSLLLKFLHGSSWLTFIVLSSTLLVRLVYVCVFSLQLCRCWSDSHLLPKWYPGVCHAVLSNCIFGYHCLATVAL